MTDISKWQDQRASLLSRCFLCIFLIAACNAKATWLIEPSSLDLGEITDAVPVSVDFRIFNRGAELIRVEDVELSDPACMEYALSASEIEPGDSIVLRLDLHPFGYAGPHEFKAVIESNRSDAPVLEPTLRVRVLPRIPPVIFDDLFASEIRTHKVRLARADDYTGTLVRAETDYSGIQASLSPTAEDRYRILVTTVPPQPVGGEIRCRVLLYEEHRAEPEITVPVWMEVLPDIVVAPDSLQLEASDHEQFRILFTRQNPQAPAGIPEVSLPDHRFRAEIVPDYDLPNWRINVYIRGMGGATGEVGSIHLRFDGESVGEFSIPVRIQPFGPTFLHPPNQ